MFVCVRENIYGCVCECVSQTDRWTGRNSQKMRERYGGMQEEEEERRGWRGAGFRMKMSEREVRLTNNLMVDLLRQ